jgi:hypothetical protein
MASRYSLEAVFRLIDNITAPLDKVKIKGTNVSNALKNDFIKTQDPVNRLGKN